MTFASSRKPSRYSAHACIILRRSGSLCALLYAKRIRTPDPRFTNSEFFGVSHINQCLANAKRGLSLWKAASIRLWWYKSGYSESVVCGFLIASRHPEFRSGQREIQTSFASCHSPVPYKTPKITTEHNKARQVHAEIPQVPGLVWNRFGFSGLGSQIKIQFLTPPFPDD
jgi:hypothetical protein